MSDIQTIEIEGGSKQQTSPVAATVLSSDSDSFFNLPARVFWAFLLLYLITWGGHYTSGDGVRKVQWAKQLVSGGPYWTDLGTGAPPKYGIGASLIAAPGMFAADVLRQNTGLHAEAAFYTLIFVLNGAMLLYFIARYLARLYSAKRVWAVVSLIGLATSWWSYTKLDFTEPLVLTLFFAAFVLLREEHELLGFATASFLLLLRTDTVVLIGLLVLWRCSTKPWKRTLLRAAFTMLPAVVATMAVNYFRFGTVVDAGYAGESFSNPLIIGLYGILFSAGKSVFLFSPPLVLGIIGWKRFRERLPYDAWLFLGVFASEVLIYSKWWDWSGDDCWGVRFVLPGVVLMTIPCAEMLQRRFMTAAVLALGIAVQLPAVLLNGLDYLYVSKKVVDMERRRQGVEGSNRVDLDDIRFNPRYNQVLGTYELLRLRMGVHSSATNDLDQSRTGTPVVETLRNLPVTSDCPFDILWCRLRR